MQFDSRARIQLEWMFENQPELVRDLNNFNKLYAHLDRKYQQALGVVLRLKKGGLDEEEAFEVAVATILAPSEKDPAFSDNAPKPLPYQEQKAIYARLDVQALAEEKRENEET